MKNQRAFTLIELVATLSIIGILLAIIVSILINGLNASNRSATNQQIQQEANYITETIRKEYLKLPSESTNSMITLTVVGDTLELNGNKISEGYEYTVPNNLIDTNDSSVYFYLEIKKNDIKYQVETTFSKLK